MGIFSRIKSQLTKTRDTLAGSIRRVLTGTSLTDKTFDELEEVLIQADIGVDTALSLVKDLRKRSRDERFENSDQLYEALKQQLTEYMSAGDHVMRWEADEKPHVTLVAGVNGSGKTTTIGKLASSLKEQGKTVILGAGDTFRAAAIDQLAIWSERTGAPLIKHREGADPAAVAFDTVDAATARHMDCVIIDTAGRLHTKSNLMEEIKKVHRVIGKRLPGAPHEVLLVLDATTGQNALQQAKLFTEAIHVTGIVITKLDGTAKGGVAIGIQRELGIPIKYIGVGEQVDDLQPFDAVEFVNALFE